MHGWVLFGSVFGIIFVAELPDKTAICAMVLATSHRPVAVLIGAATALTIQSAIAVTAGHVLSLLPERPVHLVAGGIFVVSAVAMWRRKEEAHDESSRVGGGFWRSLWVVFGVIFLAEWGDLTQLGTAALAAQYRSPWIIFAGSTLGLWAASAIAIFVGNRAARLLDPRRIQRVAATIFAVVGVVLLAGAA
jgi:putative Ca2+/H+ antiporter (TMEM165/GDT1 family)